MIILMIKMVINITVINNMVIIKNSVFKIK